MITALLIIDVLVSISLIGLILIQHGKGADVGAAFGSGASQTVFGSGGSSSFLTRATAVLAVIFFVTSLSLAYFSGQRTQVQSVVDKAALPQAPDSGLPKPADMPSAPPQNITITPKNAQENTQVQAPAESPAKPSDVPVP